MQPTSTHENPSNAMPSFMRLAGHPLRWLLLHELARSDRQVTELTKLVGERQNLVSYHLARMRAEGMVVSRRSSKDGRQTYYRADLERCAELLATSARALHPGLARVSHGPSGSGGGNRRQRVLFLCTGNSARSQMAEALVNHAGGGIEAVSAGDRPREVHSNAIRAMAARGIDISHQQAKHIEEFAGHQFDHVVTLCDLVRERCPEVPGASTSHWSVADPVDPGRSDAETYPAFEAAAAELASRVEYFLWLVAA